MENLLENLLFNCITSTGRTSFTINSYEYSFTETLYYYLKIVSKIYDVIENDNSILVLCDDEHFYEFRKGSEKANRCLSSNDLLGIRKFFKHYKKNNTSKYVIQTIKEYYTI